MMLALMNISMIWTRRFLHGEFDEADSINFDDSLKFITPGGNVVYGGGGIMPDVFIPSDTFGTHRLLQPGCATGTGLQVCV
jgi:hypothetical protein